MGNDTIVIGVRGTVLALDAATGSELWRTRLKGMDFVNVALMDGKILASTKGEIFALEPLRGSILWHNKLQGLGLGLVTIGGAPQEPASAAQRKKQQQAAAAAAS